MNSAWEPFQTAPEHYHTYSANFKQVSGMAQFRIPPMIAEASIPSLSESTPAFTKKHLIEGTGLTLRTADRVVAVLSEEDIITSGKRTARAPDQTSSSPIWEAREMYELAERVEATARRITENSAPQDTAQYETPEKIGFCYSRVP